MTQLLLAPMEGLLDYTLRDTLTRVGGIDRCVSEFIRVTGTLLPDRAFLRIVPELLSLWDKVVNSTLDFTGIRLRNATLAP